MSLKGAPQLAARLKALKLSFKPIGKQWARTTADLARPHVPVRTGKGRASVRPKNATQKRATVAANYYTAILDKGAKAHDIVPKRKPSLVFKGSSGRTIFAKRVHKPAQAGKHFARRAARESLNRHPMAETLIRQWNEAA